MEEKIDLSELLKILETFNIEELEDVTIELGEDGEMVIEIEPGQMQIPPALYKVAYYAQLLAQSLQELTGVSITIPTVPTAPEAVPEVPKVTLEPATFEIPKVKWLQEIEEITLGATKSDGGTRDYVIKVGGHKTLPFYNFEAKNPNVPVVTVDVFDMPIPLAGPVKATIEDVMEDPSDWAKKCVKEFGADMVTIHLISTDPAIKDTPSKEAAKVVEDILQAVKVPIVVGGSGVPEKDPEVLEEAAKVAEGERVLLASASLNLDYKRVAKAAIDYGHVVLSWTQLDINNQKTLNRYLFREGVPRDQIIMDPTTAALGYGLDYAFTNMQRIRISGLKGDRDLNFPMSSGTTNAWGAREAWMKQSPVEGEEWGPRELRGPLWEVVTGLTLALAGGDLFMMMHPFAVKTLKETCLQLAGMLEKEYPEITDWVSARF
ncbi:MAG: CO dehydrogenase/acetyl-CoA synthase subunit delta [Candidatus Hydrothermarchaeota archaeon]